MRRLRTYATSMMLWRCGGLSLGSPGSPSLSCDLLGSYGLSWARLGSLLPWALRGYPGLSWAAWALLGSPGLSWALLGSLGFSWALLGSSALRVGSCFWEYLICLNFVFSVGCCKALQPKCLYRPWQQLRFLMTKIQYISNHKSNLGEGSFLHFRFP